VADYCHLSHSTSEKIYIKYARNWRFATISCLLLSVSLSIHADIKVGVAGPMSGTYAWFGEQMQLGAELAVADINAAGGVLGEQLELVVGDDACDPPQAEAAANLLISEGVVFVNGHWCSSSTIPAGVVYGDAGVLMITPASTNPRVTDEGGPMFFAYQDVMTSKVLWREIIWPRTGAIKKLHFFTMVMLTEKAWQMQLKNI